MRRLEGTMIGQGSTEVHEAGLAVGGGSFDCIDCSFSVTLEAGEEMPRCPSCGGSQFRRGSMFEHDEQQPTLSGIPPVARSPEPETDWLQTACESIEQAGKYLVLYADGRTRVKRLAEGWSRIGRSDSAAIRLDDPTVSRRHAVVVRTAEGELRVLDDRSLNGIQVNGEQVDWSHLADGDELQVGRYTLHVVESAGKRPGPSSN